VYFLATRCKGELLVSSTFALCNHPMAEELSPKSRKHGNSRCVPFMIVNHTVINDAMNSNMLFLFCTFSWYSIGISHRHASPLWFYPPRPFGQALDQHRIDGLRKVMIFKLMPWCTFGRK
jgi:hypothetical protein